MKINWQTKKLREVIDDMHQGLNTAGYKIKFHKEGYPIIQSRNLESGEIDLEKRIKYMSLEDWEIYKEKYRPKKGNVFLSNIGTIGKTAVVTEEKDYLVHWNIFIFKIGNKPLDSFFLKYFLDSPVAINHFLRLQKGGTVNFITKKMIENLQIPLPPLTTQKQIVKILDEVFESISKSKENAKKNLKNAKELFESYLEEVFSNPRKDWEEKRLEELSKNKNAIVSGPFGSNLKVKDYREEGVPLIRLQNIQRRLFLDKDIKYISQKKAEELKSHSFVKGDIVLAKLGIPIGKTCIVPEEFEKGIIVADVVRIRPDKDKADYNFITYFLNSRNATLQLNGNIVGATRPRVNLSDVREIKLFIPKSLPQQTAIVQKLDALSFEVKQLEEIYKQKLESLEELKKSMLQKAFSGELTKE